MIRRRRQSERRRGWRRRQHRDRDLTGNNHRPRRGRTGRRQVTRVLTAKRIGTIGRLRLRRRLHRGGSNVSNLGRPQGRHDRDRRRTSNGGGLRHRVTVPPSLPTVSHSRRARKGDRRIPRQDLDSPHHHRHRQDGARHRWPLRRGPRRSKIFGFDQIYQTN